MNKDATMPKQKVRVVFPRRSSNKPLVSYKASPNLTGRVKSISSVSNRKSPLEEDRKVKEIVTTRHLDQKAKPTYNPMHIYNISSTNAQQLSPIQPRSSKSSIGKPGKFSIYEKTKSSTNAISKRVPKAKRNEDRKKLLGDKDSAHHSSSDRVDNIRKLPEAYYAYEPQKIVKINQLPNSKGSAGKLLGKKAN